MLDQERWTPDPMLVDAAVDGRCHATRMPDEDRCYVVAVLSERGESAEQIADRLHCSPRLVKRIRAEPLTVTLRRAHRTEQELAAARSRATLLDTLRTRDQADADTLTTRMRQQRDDAVEQLRRTRQALDHERAQRLRRANVHLHVYRRRPTLRQQLTANNPALFDLDPKDTP